MSTLRRYFIGNGFPTWVLSPFNILLDLLSLPYVNKGVYQLGDLPPAYQDEVNRLIQAARDAKSCRATGRGGEEISAYNGFLPLVRR